MNCAACNGELKAGSATCLECGHPVDQATVAPPRERTFGDYVNLAVRMIKLEDGAGLEAARDPNATMMALLFIALGGVGSSIGSLTFVTMFFLVPIALLSAGMTIGLVHLMATMLGGKAPFIELFRAQGLAYMMMWVSAVPFIGPPISFFAGLYVSVIFVFNVRAVHKLPTGHSIAAVVLPTVVFFFLIMALVMTLGVGFAVIAGAAQHH